MAASHSVPAPLIDANIFGFATLKESLGIIKASSSS